MTDAIVYIKCSRRVAKRERNMQTMLWMSLVSDLAARYFPDLARQREWWDDPCLFRRLVREHTLLLDIAPARYPKQVRVPWSCPSPTWSERA